MLCIDDPDSPENITFNFNTGDKMLTQNDWNTQKNTIRKDVNYIGKRFSSIRHNLIEFFQNLTIQKLIMILMNHHLV